MISTLITGPKVVGLLCLLGPFHGVVRAERLRRPKNCVAKGDEHRATFYWWEQQQKCEPVASFMKIVKRSKWTYSGRTQPVRVAIEEGHHRRNSFVVRNDFGLRFLTDGGFWHGESYTFTKDDLVYRVACDDGKVTMSSKGQSATAYLTPEPMPQPMSPSGESPSSAEEPGSSAEQRSNKGNCCLFVWVILLVLGALAVCICCVVKNTKNSNRSSVLVVGEEGAEESETSEGS